MLLAVQTGKAPQASQARPAPHVVGRLFARALPARKPPLSGEVVERSDDREGLCPFAVIAYCPASGVGSASLPFPVCATSVSSRSPAMLTMTVTFSVFIFVPAL